MEIIIFIAVGYIPSYICCTQKKHIFIHANADTRYMHILTHKKHRNALKSTKIKISSLEQLLFFFKRNKVWSNLLNFGLTSVFTEHILPTVEKEVERFAIIL